MNSTNVSSPLHRKLLGYPIFWDFSEIKSMRTTVCTRRSSSPLLQIGIGTPKYEANVYRTGLNQVWLLFPCLGIVLGFGQVSAHAKLGYFHSEWISVLEWQTPNKCTTFMNWISFHWGDIHGLSVLSTLTMSTVEEMDGARYTCSIKALSACSSTHGQCRVQCYSCAYNDFIFIFRWLWCGNIYKND